MRSSRLFEIIYLLMDRHTMTVTELAKKLEVSTRTIRRDIDSLSASGVPVYMSRGKGGGVHLLENYVLNKSVISENEQTEILASLAAMESTGASNSTGASERFARMFQKDTIDWLDIDFSFWGAPPDYKQAFEIIKEAILGRHVLRFTYYDAKGKNTLRNVEPMRLVFKESNWYLQAYCLERDDWRIFKLFRMNWEKMQILDNKFRPRPLPSHFETSPKIAKNSALRLRFRANAENRVREEFPPDSIELDESGSFLVSLNVPISDRSCHYLLTYGTALEVLEPAFVREWIRTEAQAMADKYV